MEQLKIIAKGDYLTPSTEKRKFGTIAFAAVSLPVTEVQGLLTDVSGKPALLSNFVLKYPEEPYIVNNCIYNLMPLKFISAVACGLMVF